MAKCAGCGGNGNCGCVFDNAGDGGFGSFPTPSIAKSGIGAAGDPIRFQLAAASDNAYVPVLPGVTMGASTIASSWKRAGKEVTWNFALTLGAGFILPATLVVPAPPPAPLPGTIGLGRSLGLGTLFDVSASSAFAGLVRGNGDAANVQVVGLGTNGAGLALTGGTPFAFAAGDSIEFILKYTTP